MNSKRPWTTGLDSGFISKLTESLNAAGIGVYGGRPIRGGSFMPPEDWERVSREIGRQIIAIHPEYKYILRIIETESPILKCPGCEMDFVPLIVKRIPGTMEMGTETSTICQECYNNCLQ